MANAYVYPDIPLSEDRIPIRNDDEEEEEEEDEEEEEIEEEQEEEEEEEEEEEGDEEEDDDDEEEEQVIVEEQGTAAVTETVHVPATTQGTVTVETETKTEKPPDGNTTVGLKREREITEDDAADDYLERKSPPRKKKATFQLQPRAADCRTYDLVPSVAAIHSMGVTGVATTDCMRWVFTGCEDGFVRKFDFFASMNGKLLLTQNQKHMFVDSVTKNQKHMFVDSVTKAGILWSYWDNEEKPVETGLDKEPTLSPVYSIEAQSEGVFVMTGMESGNVNLWSSRVDEGKCHYVFRSHTKPVSALKLAPGERSFLSGSWDSNILQWDLDSGSIVRKYPGHAAQISSISFQPKYFPSLPTPRTSVSPTKGVHDEKGGPTENGYGSGLGGDGRGGDGNVLMTTGIDGTVLLWDQREQGEIRRRGCLGLEEKTPPWCLSSCWSADGRKIYCGRRNGTVDEYDFGQGKHIRSLRLPSNSGPVSCIATMPNNSHLVCASTDTIRLYNLGMDDTAHQSGKGSGRSPVPFVIVPGHHGGVVSQIHIDPTSRYMITTSGNRGWQGQSTNLSLFYEVMPVI